MNFCLKHALVFSFLIYNPFFLLLFLFEAIPCHYYVPSSSIVRFLLSLTGIFLLLPVLTSHFDMCSVQLIFSILRHTFISKASSDVLLSHSSYFCTEQGHTSNQCFHHSFHEASSFYSILPLVILSSWKRLLSHCYPGASILGAEGRDPQILGRWVAGRVAGVSLESWTGREMLLYLIMYRKYVRKWLLLKRNRIICPEVAVNGQFFCLENRIFLIA